MTSQRPLVIVNPASRGGAGARDWPHAAASLRSHFGAFECRFTEAPGDAKRISEEEAGRGRKLVLTFGGDGTVSETVAGIVASGARCALGVLPHGTGADFIRSLALPRRVADAARALRRGRTVAIDVGSVTFAGGVSRIFVNAASFGLSAEVVRRVNQSHRSGASTSYARQTLEAALSFRHPELRLCLDGKPAKTLEITTVSVHNGRFFGGGMKMAPKAGLTDGRLDIVVVRKISFRKLLRHGPSLYFGSHLRLPEVMSATGERFEAESTKPDVDVPVEVDGEASGKLPARFEIQPKALYVRVPAES